MSAVPPFRHVDAGADRLPPECAPESGWTAELVGWFARVRISLGASCAGECSAERCADAIAKQVPPDSATGALCEVERVVSMLAQKSGELTRIDMLWAFYALVYTDRYVTKRAADALSQLLVRINRQVASAPEQENLKYLCVVSVLISSFFHVAEGD